MNNDLHIPPELITRIREQLEAVSAFIEANGPAVMPTGLPARGCLHESYGSRSARCEKVMNMGALPGWWALDQLLCDMFCELSGPGWECPQAIVDRHENIADALGALEYERTERLGLTGVGYPRLLLCHGRASVFIDAGTVEERNAVIPIRHWVGSVYNTQLRVGTPPAFTRMLKDNYNLTTFDENVVELDFLDDRVVLGHLAYGDWEVQLTKD